MDISLTFQRIVWCGRMGMALIVALALALIPAMPSAFAAGPSCTVAATGATYTTIQAAVNDTDCTSIDVAAGICTENVTSNRDVTINGATDGSTIVDGNNADTVFKILSGTVVVSNLTIQHGVASRGSGISNAGTLTLTNSTVSDNHTPTSGVSNIGGGIYNTGTLTLVSSTVSGNSASGSTSSVGGGIYNGGTLILTDSTVSGNSGSAGTSSVGGGIYNSGTLTLTGSTIRDNRTSGSASSSGSGLYNSGTSTIRTSIIKGNGSPGALFGSGLYNGGTLTLIDSSVSDNSASGGGSGGGIFNQKTLTLINSIVSGNTGVDYGGGITNSGTLTLMNSTISNNSAKSFGGCIQNSGMLTSVNSTIRNNSAASAGGGIFNVNTGSLKITNTMISSNSASSSASIYNWGAMTLVNSIVTHSSGQDYCSNSVTSDSRNSLIEDGNKLDVQIGGPLVWKTAFGTTQEAFVTLSTSDTKSPSQGVMLKAQTGRIPESGAILAVYDAHAKVVRVSTLRLGQKGIWTLYSSKAATFANGDLLGARALSNGTVQIYKNGTVLTSATLSAADQAFFNTKGGRIGIWTAAAPNTIIDDFGGRNNRAVITHCALAKAASNDDLLLAATDSPQLTLREQVFLPIVSFDALAPR